MFLLCSYYLDAPWAQLDGPRYGRTGVQFGHMIVTVMSRLNYLAYGGSYVQKVPMTKSPNAFAEIHTLHPHT
jgi:hypothetical protein